MYIGFIFWLLMVLWFLSWVGVIWGPPNGPWLHVNTVLLFALFFFLGWKVFGFVIHASVATGTVPV